MASVALTIAPAVVRATEEAVGIKLFRQPSLFIDEPDVIGGEVFAPKRKTQVQLEVEAFNALLKEKKSLQRVIERLEKKVAKTGERAAKKLEVYKTTTVTRRVFERQSTRTQAERKRAKDFASTCYALRREKKSLQRVIEKRNDLIDTHEIAIDEMNTQLKELDRYVAEQARSLDRHQVFIDKCMMNLQKRADGKPVWIPSLVCIDCTRDGKEAKHPLYMFQPKVPKSFNKAKHWVINPVCHSCRKERLKRIDKQRKEKRAAYQRYMATGDEESAEQRQQAISQMADGMAEAALGSLMGEELE